MTTSVCFRSGEVYVQHANRHPDDKAKRKEEGSGAPLLPGRAQVLHPLEALQEAWQSQKSVNMRIDVLPWHPAFLMKGWSPKRIHLNSKSFLKSKFPLIRTSYYLAVAVNVHSNLSFLAVCCCLYCLVVFDNKVLWTWTWSSWYSSWWIDLLWLSSCPVTIDSIHEVCEGKKSEIFQRYADSRFDPNCCFSIYHGSHVESLDLVTTSGDEARTWITGLKYLMAGISDEDSLARRQRVRDQYPSNPRGCYGHWWYKVFKAC